MDALSREFQEQLSDWRLRYEGQPRGELLRLLFLALEREQMVTVSYRERLIADRLQRTALPPEVRELIRHALIWVWKDEEMHAVFVRGLLLKLGGLPLKLRCLVEQLNGTLGGWAGSIRMHVPWSRAPILRSVATALQCLGAVAGKVPREVRKELEYQPFRRFCEFNIDAERTASLCWDRVIEISTGMSDLPADLVDEFRRMKTDEDNHVRIFDAVGRTVDLNDGLAAGESEATLLKRLAAVGDEFLPRAHRGLSPELNPLGTGGRVVVREGKDKLAVFRRALDEAGLPAVLARRKPGFRVAIKAGFMLGYHRRDPSPYVDPEFVAFLARYLRERGASDVAVVEGRNLYDRFYKNRTVHDVARYLGFMSEEYRIVDLSLEQVPHRFGRGMAHTTVGRTWKEADLRIAIGKMKSHPVDVFTLSLAALEGLGPRNEDFLFAERQAHRSQAIMTLLSDFPPHFAVVDAYDRVPDGILGMMGSVHTKRPRRVYAGEDAVAVDAVAARHLGGTDPHASAIFRDACAWFGDPSGRVTVDGPEEPIRGWRGPYGNEISALLSSVSFPFYTLFSGRGTLFVPEMDERAFPPIGRENLLLRIARRSLQTLLILRHMK